MHWSLSIPLKTSENVLFSDVFRRYWKKSVTWNGLIWRHFSPCGTHVAPTAFQRKRTNTTVLDSRHLKVKQQDISLTRNHCITISIQKIRISIQKDTADFRKSHKLKGHDHFDHAHTNIIETPFSFSQFIPACKKSVYSICSLLK